MYTRIVQQAIDLNYRMCLTEQHEWRSDYPWFIARLHGGAVLDLGYMAHAFFTKILLKYGFSVTGVDLAEPEAEARLSPERGAFRHVTAFVGDLPFPENTFSTVVAPSLLEHLGLGFYGDAVSDEPERASRAALDEWFRVLEPGGVVLAQVPYGRTGRVVRFKGKPYYRVYTAEAIRAQFTRFRVEDLAFHSLEPHGWIEVSQSVADHIDHTEPFPPCIAKLVARRPPLEVSRDERRAASPKGGRSARS